jgi:hypothetical protein
MIESEKIRALKAEFSRKLSVVKLDELQANQVCLPRKIISTGAGSFCVVLPKVWCTAHSLKGRDEVYIQFDPSGILRICPDKPSQGDAKTIE